MKQVDLSNLPTFTSGNNKGKINWVSSVGYKINFIYNDESGQLLIKDYDKKTFYVTIEYNAKVMNIRSTNLKLCHISKLFGYGEYKYKVGDIINTKSGKIKIIQTIKNKKIDKEKIYYCKCLNCGYKRIIREHSFVNGNGCPKCGDGVSYPEKFIIEMFSQLQEKFQIQKVFKWSEKKKYDIFVKKQHMIIEVNGLQHYSGNFGKFVQEIIREDQIKKSLALKHNIKNYIYIDARKSDPEYIKTSIINSDLPKFYNLNSINWKKCDIQACNSYIKLVCNDWNNYISVKELSKKYHLCTRTIQNYLRKGNKLNWCIYNKHINMSGHPSSTAKKVLCTTTGKIFNSQKEAAKFYNIYETGIGDCCNGRISTAGKFNGEKLKWKHIA